MSAALYDFGARSPAPVHSLHGSDRSRRFLQSAPQTEPQEGMHGRNISQSLELSESRAYDSALSILSAYKLSGNFPAELEVVLRALSVLDKVTYVIEPKSPLSDLRQVTFRPNNNVHADRFREIMGLINDRIGFAATLPWWLRLFPHRLSIPSL